MSITTLTSKPRTLGAVVVVLTLAVLAAIVVTGNGSDADASPRSNLDAIAGFGVTPDDALRDDTIALWEAFKREQIVQRCMRRAGFAYQIEVAFPASAVVGVAHELEPLPRVRGTASLATAGPSQNRSYSDGLTLSERDRYFQALYGESAADVDLVDGTGVLPEGRDDFAVTGCFGAATNRIPGVYAARRALAEPLATMRRGAVASAEPAPSRRCPAPLSLEAGDELLAEGMEPASRACEAQAAAAARDARVAADNEFYAVYRGRLEAHQARYAGALTRVEQDRPFQVYLARLLPGLEAELDATEVEQRDE